VTKKPAREKPLEVCPKCGWYAHGPYASPTDCDAAAGDAASTLQAAVPEVPSTKLGYGQGVVAFEIDDELHVRLRTCSRVYSDFHLDAVWLLADLSHDDAVDLVRTIAAWRGRQIDRSTRRAAAKPYVVVRSELSPVDVESAVHRARRFLAERGEHDLPRHQATTREFARALVTLADREPRTVVIDRPNEYDPPTEVELHAPRPLPFELERCACGAPRNPGVRHGPDGCARDDIAAEIDAKRSQSWLGKIEALKPGDACEFHYPARRAWLPGTIVKNGGSNFWSVRDDSDAEGRRGQVSDCLYIEMIRLPGQTEAWT